MVLPNHLSDRHLRSFVEVPSGVAQQTFDASSIIDTLIDEASGTVTYVGEAPPGSSTSSAVWRIQKIDTSANPTSVKWANGSYLFDKTWDDRASYTY